MKPISRYETGTEMLVIAKADVSRSLPSDPSTASFSLSGNIYHQTGDVIILKPH